jgi:hypothetical protein
VKASALLAGLATAAALAAGQQRRTFTGVIIDDQCAKEGHAWMRMGPSDADCTRACVATHGAAYVLLDGREIYLLSDQQLPEKFAGRKVKVAGTLDAGTKTIRVESIAAAD